MSAIREIIEAFYTVVDSMTKANGYNLDWIPEKSGEQLFNRGKTKNRISIYATTGENLDGQELGGGDQGVWNLRLGIEVHAKIPMKGLHNADEVPYETSLDVADGLEDVLNAFEKNSKQSDVICATSAYNWDFVDYETELMPREDKYNGIKLICRYLLDYRSPMGQRL
jgi:hypothetical protein